MCVSLDYRYPTTSAVTSSLSSSSPFKHSTHKRFLNAVGPGREMLGKPCIACTDIFNEAEK